ncbi:RDD family protein [Microbacterium sp. JZ101]
MSGWAIIDAREAAPEPTPVSVDRAAQLGLRAAPLGRRIGAAAIDALPAAVFAAPVALAPRAILTGELLWILIAATGALLLVVYGLVQLASHGSRGQTFGKQLLQLRTVRADTLRPIGFWRAVLKAGIPVSAGVVPVVGTAVVLLSPLWDREGRRRGWHDHAARAWLIDLRAVDPTDPIAFEAARGRARARVDAAPAPSAAAPSAASAPSAAPVPSAPAEPAPSAPAQARVRLDTGEEYLVSGLCLVGRMPAPEPDERVAYALPVRDDARSVSKTHFALDVRAEGMAVLDRGSGNGTRVIRTGVEYPVAVGVPVPIRPGDRIRFGDRTMEVLHV